MDRIELSTLALSIRDGGNSAANVERIRNLSATANGAESLRLIVRDDIMGSADLIADALWGLL